MTDAKQLSQPLPLTNVGNIQNMITHNEVQLPDVSQIEQMRATACRRVVAMDVDQQMKQTMFNKLQCTQDMINEQPLTENERASMMASLDVGDQSEASIAAASQLVAQKMKVMEAFKKKVAAPLGRGQRAFFRHACRESSAPLVERTKNSG